MDDNTTPTGNGNGATANNTTNNNKAVASGGPLETSKSERHVWLMKCPPMVSRSLQSPFSVDAASSGPAAKVIVAVDPLLPNNDFSSTQFLNFRLGTSIGGFSLHISHLSNHFLLPTFIHCLYDAQFTMELAGTESGNVPKCYSMDMSTDIVPMSVFSESSQGKLSVEGKIYHKFDMKPHNENLESYGKLCRERTNKYMTKTRQIQVIDNDNGLHMRPMPGMIALRASGSSDKKKLPVKGSDTKRTRRDRGEMEEIMFKLFERQSNWTLKQLLHETDQPEQFLKDMLKDLCFYNNKGTNQGTYELKPEYKKTAEEPDSK